jgi:two-component system NtrC family sensor kinase
MPSHRPESPRILLIEPDCQVLSDLSAAFSEAHFQICCCHGVEEALESIACQPPDAIISDAVLNGLSDGEFCRRVKQQPAMKDVPLMFLSPAQTPDIIRRHDVYGGIYYLRKPCDPQILLQLLERELDFAPVSR